MNNYIVLEFSGWAKIEPKNARFVSLKNNNENNEYYIDGEAWLALDKDERNWYVLEDAITFQRDSVDSEFTSLDIFVEDEEA